MRAGKQTAFQSPSNTFFIARWYLQPSPLVWDLILVWFKHMNRLMGKPTICICGNKDVDQLRGNREAGLAPLFSLLGKYNPSSS